MFGSSVRTLVVMAGVAAFAATSVSAQISPAARQAVCPVDVPSPHATAGTLPGPGQQGGLAISVAAAETGGVVVKAAGHGLDVRKLVARDGSFTLTIAAAGDTLALAGSSRGVVVTRGGKSVRVDTAGTDPGAFSRSAALLAGSPALRVFRGAVSALDAPTRETVGGAALEIGDVLLRILQDDAGAVVRWRNARGERTGGLIRAAFGMRKPCFAEWEQEVIEAWDWYEACYHDFSWWSGGREACAFVYILRVEAAWFQFLTCVGFRQE
jgi:hypothetical protein